MWTLIPKLPVNDHKMTLLYRFHITLIVVNLLALGIDLVASRYANAAIEFSVIAALILSLWYLVRYQHLSISAYVFLFILSTALFTLIYINSFATMSVVFVLLLPLTTLLFIRLRYSLLLSVLLFTVMAALLYMESLNNPENPLIQNPQALFNLAYAAVIIYIFGLLYHFSIIKTFAELDASNRQKEMLLKEVHHRVKNNLNVIASIIGLQANRTEGKGKEQLRLSKTRIESIAMVHEMLYQCDDFEYIDFHAYMKQLSVLLLGMFSNQKKIHVNVEAREMRVPLEVMLQLGIIANELLTNSIKYAFEKEGGTITIGLEHQDDGYVFICRDDGRGVEAPEALLRNNSLGVKLVHLCVKQLKGTLTLTSSQGLEYRITFENH